MAVYVSEPHVRMTLKVRPAVTELKPPGCDSMLADRSITHIREFDTGV